MIAEFLRKASLVWQRPVDKALANVFLELTMEYDIRQMTKGMTDFWRNEERFPSPASLIKHMEGHAPEFYP
jgi:hypothetical protein